MSEEFPPIPTPQEDFVNVTYSSLKTINRPLKTFFCNTYSMLDDVNTYLKRVRESINNNHRFQKKYRGLIHFHQSCVPFCCRKKLNNCTISKEMCWEYIETQFSAFQRAYIYYRDSEYAFGETRIKLITRIKEMHYMLWGLDILINEYSIHYRQFVFIIDTVEENLGNDWSLLFDRMFARDLHRFQVKVFDFMKEMNIENVPFFGAQDISGQDWLDGNAVDEVMKAVKRTGLIRC